MKKMYDASPRQIEDWHYNYILKKEQPANIIKMEVSLPTLDVSSFKLAYEALLQRHESVRTYFPCVNGQIKQQVNAYDVSMFGLTYIESEPDSKPVQKLLKTIRSSMKDIVRGPLIKGILIKKPGQGYVFILYIHHIISDFWSLNILKSELKILYHQFSHAVENTIDLPAQQLGAYIQSRHLQFHAQHEATLQYWLDKLIDKQWQTSFDKIYRLITNCPGGLPGANKYRSAADLIRKPRGESYTICLDPHLHDRLQEFKANTYTGTFSMLLAGFNLLHLQLTNNEQVLIQSHYMNRHDQATEKLIGNLIGKVLLHQVINKKLSVRDFILDCNQTFIDSIGRMVFNSEKLTPLQLTTHSFLFFNFINKEMKRENDFPITEPVLSDKVWAESPLVCQAQEYSNTIVFRWSYHTGFMNAVVMKNIAGRFFNVLEQMLMHPNATIERLRQPTTLPA